MIILITGMNQSFINKIKSEKYFYHLRPRALHPSLYNNLFLESDRWRYGDLYGLCYLHRYKIALEPFTKYPTPRNKNENNRALYIIGDSFLADKELNGAFDAFDYVVFLDRRFPFGAIKLDTALDNYLILEFAERNLAQYYKKTSPGIKLPIGEKQLNITKSASENSSKKDLKGKSITSRIHDIIFNKDLDRNLQLLIFDNKYLTPVKELKAQINYTLFNRLPADVSESTSKDRLFLGITVDTSSNQSAMRQISDSNVNKICRALRFDYNYYREIGFKDVAISIVPNPVSIYNNDSGKYNHLLERIESQVHVPVISVYDTFKSEKQNLYYRSDAHWNPKGMNLWVEKTNMFFNESLISGSSSEK
ncbi:hypothetical protein FPZ43_17075 [Mucilaginibacter pallidiroseus]|uniref:AlgX/AlgJ SGNH hydrolase-like domain-containing protein n=1 Tax=Mucilaginibacter pallidiroseus TaxID=2599295 RepID=A0A563U0M7_9SPHI|nr:hypothetical protein [Mucilaginibacter pallidiroseus]TWR25184.1 hypothetical protein FPZ43_17075 [Mucilaginibacter pallidiroseus]